MNPKEYKELKTCELIGPIKIPGLEISNRGYYLKEKKCQRFHLIPPLPISP
jgi:hypothetical protein